MKLKLEFIKVDAYTDAEGDDWNLMWFWVKFKEEHLGDTLYLADLESVWDNNQLLRNMIEKMQVRFEDVIKKTSRVKKVEWI